MTTGKFSKGVLLLFTLITSICTKAQLGANFSATPTNGCAPLVVRFNDQSTGNPDSWKWDLGNGTISYLQNPSVVYFTPGKYSIKLVIKNQNNEDSVTKQDFIEVFAAPQVNFAVNNTSGCYPLDVSFTDLSTTSNGTLNSWLWDFGDGVTSTDQNPVHTYTSAKNFNVTLQLKNTNGCVSTLVKNSLVQINEGVLADFTNDHPQTCTAPVTINFQNQSTGTGAVQYSWDFGDGSTSNLLNPSHIYTNIGTYTVTLVVVNNTGCRDTIIKQNAITVGSVKAGFQAPPTICQNMNVAFTNSSTPAPNTVLWSFGDGTTSTEFSPTKKFLLAGTYTVKMVANFGACTDSQTVQVQVLPKPVVNFTASDSTGCAKPFTVNFTTQGQSGLSYVWDLGDNTSSTNANPAHTYTNFGNYTVKLIATNNNGCTDTITKPSFIIVRKTTATVRNLPDSGCVPFTKKFLPTVSTVDPVIGYQWNFGDGNTSTSPSPTHTYTTEGAYTVTLIVTTASGCSDTLIVPRGIVTSGKPVTNFSASPLNACAKVSINFTDLSEAGVSRWLWSFGDNTTSAVKNPIHQYSDTGYFDVQLIVWKGGCADSVKFTKYIHINPPVAKFGVTSNCNTPMARTFTDYSIGADQWFWDFGDGTNSTVKNPLHTYAVSGSYTVTLRVVNNTFGCDYTTSRIIKIISNNTDFSAIDPEICKGERVNFTTNASLSEIAQLSWNFGDGTASENSPLNSNRASHIYNQPGFFNVQLITTDANGCKDTLVKTAYIQVNGPTAKFAVANNESCSNSTIVMSDSSVSDGRNPLQSWVWNYGDGSSDSLTAGPFQHNYSQAGSYSIKLKVQDSKGCTDSFEAVSPIIIDNPQANFSTLDSLSCPGKPIKFISQSIGTNLSYQWDFGDNDTDTVANPSHAYAADGIYNVKLIIRGSFGCTDSITKNAYIKVSTPLANFVMSDSVSNCPPLIINFTDLSTNAISRRWDFGDSTYSTEVNPTHFYNYAGSFTVTLTVSSGGGCTSTFQRSVVVKGPEGTFTYQPIVGCNPVSVNFSATTTNSQNSIIWDFNDGTTTVTGVYNTSHTYNFSGTYVPKMILVDPAGCKVPIPGKDTIRISGVAANFTFNNKALCDTGIINFTDSSVATNDVITQYRWVMGDGNTSLLPNPAYQFTTPGIYYPKLVVTTSNGCTDSITTTQAIKVVAAPKISIGYSGNTCAPLTAQFTAQIQVPDTSAITWQWNFANGNTSIASNPVAQLYPLAGVYNVTLTGTNSTGCKTTVTIPAESYAIPVVSAGADTLLCKGSSITLKATGADTYVWSPAANLSCTNCASPATNTPDDKTYYVTGSSIHGCSAKDTILVRVKTKFVLTHSASDSVCKGQTKKITAAGAYSYVWSPAASLDNANIASPTAMPDITTQYTVIATDDRGCFKDTGYVNIKVNPIPTVEAGIDQTINVGKSIDLVPTISTDVSDVNWQPTTGIFRNFWPGVTVKPKENTEYTVEVKNRGGCKARDRVTVFVICNGSNIFVPNTFSPNADGTNDIFYARGTGLFKIRNIKIFNRWGEVVFDRSSFDANNPAYGWDGTNKGVPLNADVFVYSMEVLCDNGSVLTYRGNIALIR